MVASLITIMVQKRTSSSRKSVYTKEKEEKYSFSSVITCRLRIDPETGKQVCEICSDLLSVSVEGDYPITCRSCGMKVNYQIDYLIHRYIRRACCMKVLERHLCVICVKQVSKNHHRSSLILLKW